MTLTRNGAALTSAQQVDACNGLGAAMQRERPLDRVRRLASSRGRTEHPWVLAPLVGAIAWAASTAVAVGDVRSNDTGKTYICTTAGTTAASGGPTGKGSSISDGTAVWDYNGPQTAPVWSITATKPGTANAQRTLTNPAPINVRYGGAQITTASGGVIGWDSSVGAGVAGNVETGHSGTGWFIEVETDEQVFVLDCRTNSSSAYRVIVTDLDSNGNFGPRYIDLIPRIPNANNGASHCFNVLDFTNVGGRKPRRIRFELGGQIICHNLWTSVFSTIWKPPLHDQLKIAFLGDSWTQAGTQSVNGRRGGYADICCWMLGGDECLSSGSPSTGYVHINTNGGNFPQQLLNFAGRYTDVTDTDPHIVIIHGGTNDDPADLAGIQANAFMTINGIRSVKPSLPIFVAGINTYFAASVNNVQIENAIFAAVDAFIAQQTALGLDPLIYKIPVATDPAGFWITGSSNTGTPTSGNSAIYIGTNNHLNDAGMAYYGRKMAAAILQKIRDIIG